MKKLALILAAACLIGPAVSSASAQTFPGFSNLLQGLASRGAGSPYNSGFPYAQNNYGNAFTQNNFGALSSGNTLVGSLANITPSQFRRLKKMDPQLKSIRLSDLQNPANAGMTLNQLISMRLGGWNSGMLNNMGSSYMGNNYPYGYGTNNPYLGSNGYGTNNPYLGSNSYGTNNPYLGSNGYGTNNPYLGSNGYGTNNPYLGNNSYTGHNRNWGNNASSTGNNPNLSTNPFTHSGSFSPGHLVSGGHIGWKPAGLGWLNGNNNSSSSSNANTSGNRSWHHHQFGS